MSDQALALKLWVVLNRARNAVSEHDQAHIESRGITPGEFAVLEALYHKGPLLLGEIRSKILVSSGGVTYLVDKLVRRGMVERQACPSDRRASYAALTEDGRQWIGDVFPEHARSIERAVAGLDDDEKRRAIELLRKLGLHAAELDSTSPVPA
ncbi:MAG: MarR family transcriptional regulator [Gemmatimonadota bacterium]|jgi:MarR family 2-MHQ and catechol resistance regulon transcriptional repressor